MSMEAWIDAAVSPLEPEPTGSCTVACFYCGLGLYPGGYSQAPTIDHLVPRSAGGSDDPANLVPCCKSCNSAKGTQSLDEWYDRCCSMASEAVSRLFWIIGEDDTQRLRRLLTLLASEAP